VAIVAGKGRMPRCLAEHMGEAGFSNACRTELRKRLLAAQVDYRLDYGVAGACATDVGALCASEAQAPGGPAQVPACLMAKFKLLSGA
jgi:hypothetical protein